MTTLRVLDIVEGTSVDGVGLRTSIYFAGCTHHCKGCHNPQSWDILSGREMSIDDIMSIIIENDYNVTFSGGDPLFQIDGLCLLAQLIIAAGYKIWCYTGYTYEEVVASTKLSTILPYLEVLVDGRYMESLRDIDLLFRGSSNQRLIDVKHSTLNHIVEWHR